MRRLAITFVLAVVLMVVLSACMSVAYSTHPGGEVYRTDVYHWTPNGWKLYKTYNEDSQ
jgi:hypothetical protein